MVPWEEIKNYWRNEFHQNEIYSDEIEHIITFKQSDDSVIIIGYLHYESKFWMSANDFIDFIRNLGIKSSNSYKIFLLCNEHLSSIKKAYDILTLPQDVEYYYVDYNYIFETIKFKHESRVKAAEDSHSWEKINIPWYQRKGIPVITDSRFDDWNIWAAKGFEREWYDLGEDERFDYWYYHMVLADVEWYIDERLLGFYVVWKWQ